MQPPPRKVKESQQVKSSLSEQLSKSQSKHQQDSELSEEIRSFSKQRAAIEKEYGQASQRLAIQYQKRDWQRGNTDAVTSGSVFVVWRSVVDATAHAAASRLAAAEEYRRLFGHASRKLHNAKEIRVKRGVERSQRVQGEVVDASRESHRVKKSYHHLSHIASVAREKAADAPTRGRKSELGIFHFRSGLHKITAKLGARSKECEERLIEARNEYSSTLAAVNAHQHHYHTHELPLLMEQMDGDVYDDMRHHFTRLCGTEMDVCSASHKQFSRIWDGVAKMSASQDMQASEGESCLVKEAKKWAAKAAKAYKIVTHGERALEMSGSRSKSLSGETGLSVEQKIVEIQETVRKAKLERVKAEARSAVLSHSITGVEQWLHNAMKQAEEESEIERRLSEQRRSTEEFSEDEFESTDYEDEGGDIFADPVSASGVCVYPAACRVVYNYQASQSDELSVTEGEELHVIEDGDVEDWSKVCNACGQVGYVPERYVQFSCLPEEDPAQSDSSFSSTSSSGIKERAGSTGSAKASYSYQAQSAEESSFKEGALIRVIRCPSGEVDDGFWEGELDGRIGVFPSSSVEFLHDKEEKEEEEKEEKPLHTATLPPCSAPIPIPTAFGDGSANPPTPPCDVEDKQLSVSIEGSTILAEAEARGHTPPEIPSDRIKPCRAPPPPPTSSN